MCIVIDANVLSLAFSNNPGDDLAPVMDWIRTGEGKIVVGGAHYMREVRKVTKALMAISQLGKARKVFRVNDDDVDRLENAIRKVVSTKCDDPHLIALIGVSRCPLICTDDSRADRFLTDRSLYPWPGFRPKIYRNARHAGTLLTRSNAEARCYEDASHNPHFESFIRKCEIQEGNSR